MLGIYLPYIRVTWKGSRPTTEQGRVQTGYVKPWRWIYAGKRTRDNQDDSYAQRLAWRAGHANDMDRSQPLWLTIWLQAKGVHGRTGRPKYPAQSNICTDIRASICITGSFENTADVTEKLVRVEMAENRTSMKATHACMETYFLKNRSRAVVSLTVPALCVKSVSPQIFNCSK